MLSLPGPFQGTPAERQAACQLLLQAAQRASELGGGGGRPLLPTSASAADAGMDLSAALAAAPCKGGFSRFFGRTGADGAPLLVPPPRSTAGRSSRRAGALSAAVGDALAVQVLVNNTLAAALPLRELTLTLAVLQEMRGGWGGWQHGCSPCCTACALWRPGCALRQAIARAPLARPHPYCLHPPSLPAVIHSPVASPRAPTPLRERGLRRGASASVAAHPGTPLSEAGALGALSLGLEREESVVLPQERFETQWQQVEELACPLVAVSSGGSGGGSGGGPSLRPLVGEVLVPPGDSVLTFLAAPVQRGLYRALGLRARLHQLPLRVAVAAPEPMWQQQQHAAGGSRRSSGASTAGSRRGSRAGAPGGEPLTPLAGGAPLTPPPAARPSDAPAGAHAAEAILLHVEQAQPRVQLSLVAATGSIVAGQEQWLGLTVMPERDALHGARLELAWPLAPAGGLAGARKQGDARVSEVMESVPHCLRPFCARGCAGLAALILQQC